MPDKFDLYREGLVMETNTVWPDAYDHLDLGQRAEMEAALHADPENAAILEYVRVHTGFCRQITVTEADIQRISG